MVKLILNIMMNFILSIKKQYKSNFKLGYATTIYSKQGSSVLGYYFPEEDIKHIDGKTLYTSVSRLKTK